MEPAFAPITLVAPAKLTVSLRVLGVRADGYHLIDAEMVMKRASPLRRFGRVTALGQGSLSVAGLGRFARLGDQVEIRPAAADPVGGEVIALNRDHAIVMTYQGITGLAISDHAAVLGECGTSTPSSRWPSSSSTNGVSTCHR